MFLHQEIENKIKISPFIKDAIVIGDRRKFLSALIGIEFDTVSNWALRKNIPHTTYRDLSEKERSKRFSLERNYQKQMKRHHLLKLENLE